MQEVLEQVVLSALDGAACRLGASREELVLAFVDEQSLAAFATKYGISTADAEHAVRDGLVRGADDAEEAGALYGGVAELIRSAIQRIPPRLALDLLQQLRS